MSSEVVLSKGRNELFKSTEYILRRREGVLLGVDAYLDRTENNPAPYYAIFWRAPVTLETFLAAVNQAQVACATKGFDADDETSPRAYTVDTAHIRGEGLPLTITSELIDEQGSIIDSSTVVSPRREGTVRFAYPYNVDQLADQFVDLENVLAIRIATPYGDFSFDDTEYVRRVQAHFVPKEYPMIAIVTHKPIVEEFAAFINATQPELIPHDVTPVLREIAERL